MAAPPFLASRVHDEPMKRIYLDHAATTPVDPEVLEAMLPYLQGEYGNPSSVHSFGQRARGAIDEARAQVAALIGARDSEIVFTGSGTEADNLAVIGALGTAATEDPARTGFVTSAIEHHAVLNTAKGLDRDRHSVAVVPSGESGRVEPRAFEEAMTKHTALVSLMFANNETGAIQPIADVAEAARARGVLFHTDAVQALGKVPIDVGALNVDLMSLSAHKIHGPKGVGALYVKGGTRMHALIRGGSQERNRRAGTENVAGIVGFGVAARLAGERRDQDAPRVAALRDDLERQLLTIDGASINGAAATRIPTTTNVSFAGVSGEDLLIALDMAGIAVSTGAACAAGSPEPSHVLKAMGLPRERVNSSLRFSLGRGTTASDVGDVSRAVTEAVARLRDALRR